ncbi:MAG: hypothetical protein ACJAS1_000528 [Oleiphilaceae bacterium]|jgi:hypothetical protein
MMEIKGYEEIIASLRSTDDVITEYIRAKKVVAHIKEADSKNLDLIMQAELVVRQLEK